MAMIRSHVMVFTCTHTLLLELDTESGRHISTPYEYAFFPSAPYREIALVLLYC